MKRSSIDLFAFHKLVVLWYSRVVKQRAASVSAVCASSRTPFTLLFDLNSIIVRPVSLSNSGLLSGLQVIKLSQHPKCKRATEHLNIRKGSLRKQ